LRILTFFFVLLTYFRNTRCYVVLTVQVRMDKNILKFKLQQNFPTLKSAVNIV